MNNYSVINAENLILGRMATVVAKRLLLGEKIIIINAEKAIISGKYHSVVEDYKKRLETRTLTQPLQGPFHYRKPDRLVRRTIRGMLPWKTPRGKKAFHNLKVYIGIPEMIQKQNIQYETIKEASISRIKEKFVQIEEISKNIGGAIKKL